MCRFKNISEQTYSFSHFDLLVGRSGKSTILQGNFVLMNFVGQNAEIRNVDTSNFWSPKFILDE